jgi:hypothetical protein
MSNMEKLLEEKRPWTYWAKGALMAAVAVATVLETQDVPAWLKIVASCTIGIGTIFGIASRGFSR